METIKDVNIIYGNRLITTFLKSKNCFIYNPIFNESWDDIMFVVDKIKNIPYINFNLSSFDGCGFYDDDYKCTAFGLCINAKADTMLESVWFAVVKFVEYYNKTTDKNNRKI